MGDAPWEAFDRGSPAGRALYALYNGNKDTKEAGKKYSQQNREAFKNQTQKTLEESLAAEKERKKLASQKPVVDYPKAAPRKGPSVAPVELLRGRKSEAAIRDGMQAEEPAPELPKKKVLGEPEKQKLQDMMEWRGKPPPKEVVAPARPPRKTEVEELEETFSLLMSEIEDRRRFLDEMEAAGRRGEYEPRINGEIAQRIKQLEKLDAKLKSHNV